MDYPQRPRSQLLAQILQQMDRQAQFQPQSYGALAAGLGAEFLNKRTFDKAMTAEKSQEQNVRALQADLLTGRASPRYENPAAGPMVELAAPQDTVARLMEQGGPGAVAETAQLSQMLAPPKPPEPLSAAGKLRSDLKQNFITDDDYARETAQAQQNQAREIQLAQFLYPSDVRKQREFVESTQSRPADLPAQVQIAMWAADGDNTKARELVLNGLEKGQPVTLSGIMGRIVNKLSNGETLSPGEQAAMDWYKQNPLAALIGLMGAQPGAKVTE